MYITLTVGGLYGGCGAEVTVCLGPGIPVEGWPWGLLSALVRGGPLSLEAGEGNAMALRSLCLCLTVPIGEVAVAALGYVEGGEVRQQWIRYPPL